MKHLQTPIGIIILAFIIIISAILEMATKSTIFAITGSIAFILGIFTLTQDFNQTKTKDNETISKGSSQN